MYFAKKLVEWKFAIFSKVQQIATFLPVIDFTRYIRGPKWTHMELLNVSHALLAAVGLLLVLVTDRGH